MWFSFRTHGVYEKYTRCVRKIHTVCTKCVVDVYRAHSLFTVSQALRCLYYRGGGGAEVRGYENRAFRRYGGTEVRRYENRPYAENRRASYSRTPVPPYLRTPEPPHPRTPVPPYPRTPEKVYPRTSVPPYPRTPVPPYLPTPSPRIVPSHFIILNVRAHTILFIY